MAYIIDGNLYLQDSGKQPVQLTNSGKDHTPTFSDDGQKIVFYRGATQSLINKGNLVYSAEQYADRYVINADGSQEQVLLPPGSLTKLNRGYGKFTKFYNFNFIPGTHDLIFNTCEVKSANDATGNLSSIDIRSNQDLLIVNTDSMEIKSLLAPDKAGIFELSPDKKLDIAYTEKYIDVVGTYEKIVRHHMIPYKSAWESEMTSTSWSQDSTKFVFVAPLTGNGDGLDGPEPESIWQYSIGKNSVREIRFNPPLMNNYFTFSPDGNWVVYHYFAYPGKTDETFPAGVYVGNLLDGSSHQATMPTGLPGPDDAYYQWNQKSDHFMMYHDSDRDKTIYLGNTQGEIVPLTTAKLWIGWLDNQRYLFYRSDKLIMGELGKEEMMPVLSLPVGLKDLHANSFAYVFRNRP